MFKHACTTAKLQTQTILTKVCIHKRQSSFQRIRPVAINFTEHTNHTNKNKNKNENEIEEEIRTKREEVILWNCYYTK